MSFQTNAALVNAQAILTANFQNPELRSKDNATFRGVLDTSNIMFPNYVDLRKREDRAVDAKFINRSSRALVAGRLHNHTGTVGAAGSLTPSWTTASDPFAITLKQADNNVFEHAQMLASEFENSFLNFNSENETDATNFLFAGRSEINNGTQQGVFNAADDVFRVTEADLGTRFMQVVASNMEVNKYRGALDIYCDTVAFDLFKYQSNQGAGNSSNLSFQFQDGQNKFIHSVELGALGAGLSGAYSKGFCIAVPRGTVAALPWIPIQNRNGHVDEEGTYGTIINPADGLPYAIHTYKERSNGTAKGGYTQDVTTEFEISIDMAFEKAPLSTATESTLMAFALV